jgi:hypothetical protein
MFIRDGFWFENQLEERGSEGECLVHHRASIELQSRLQSGYSGEKSGVWRLLY